jgi:hypothetical protein
MKEERKKRKEKKIFLKGTHDNFLLGYIESKHNEVHIKYRPKKIVLKGTRDSFLLSHIKGKHNYKIWGYDKAGCGFIYS